MLIRRAYKYRLYLTKAQRSTLNRTLEFCRGLYNAALQERRDAYSKQKISLNYSSQCAQLPDIKAICPELLEVHSQVLQNVLRRLDKAYENFFRRVEQGEVPGFPRFKKYNRYNSFTYPQGGSRAGFKLNSNLLHLSKIGDVYVQLHRPPQGTIKTCSIKRDGNQWFVVFSCIVEKPDIIHPNQDVVGIDLGIEHFATLSTGEHIANPRYYRKAERHLARTQRRWSKQKTASRKLALQAAHRKVRNQRLDFHHQVSRQLTQRYSTIVVEDLNVKKLSQTKLAKSVSDVGWARFLEMLVYKAEEAGGQVLKINPAFTSQTCPACGLVKPKKLAQRQHKCECGFEAHRDVAAAQVILARSVAKS